MAIRLNDLCTGSESMTDEEILKMAELNLDLAMRSATRPTEFVVPKVVVDRGLIGRLVDLYRPSFGIRISWYENRDSKTVFIRLERQAFNMALENRKKKMEGKQ